MEIAGSEYPAAISFDADRNASITITASLDSPPSQAIINTIAVSTGATAKQGDNTITDGSIVLITEDAGARSISLSVTAEDGTIRDYTITINIVNSDANIDSLTLAIGGTNYDVSFDGNNAEVRHGLQTGGTVPETLILRTLSLSANASAKDQDGNTVTTGSTVKIATSGNDRSISITVTAEDGSTNTYTINIVVVSNNATITSLTLTISSTDYQANFDTSDRAIIAVPITSPAATIPSSVTVKTITLADGATATDGASATVTDGSTVTLVDGGGRQRIFTLVIEDANNLTRTYTVLVQFVNTQANIDSLALTINGNDYTVPTFDANGNADVTASASFNDIPSQATIQSISFSDDATVRDQNTNTITATSIVLIV